MLFKFNGLKAHKREETGMEYCGIDVHQKYSEICILAEDGEVMERTRVQTTRRALERFFSKKEPMKIVLEAGGSSPWVSRLIEDCGHETVVCSPRRNTGDTPQLHEVRCATNLRSPDSIRRCQE